MNRACGKLHFNVVMVLPEECNKEVYDVTEDLIVHCTFKNNYPK